MARDALVRLDGAAALAGVLPVWQEELEANVDHEDDVDDPVENKKRLRATPSVA